jgi:hypothetical protein
MDDFKYLGSYWKSLAESFKNPTLMLPYLYMLIMLAILQALQLTTEPNTKNFIIYTIISSLLSLYLTSMALAGIGEFHRTKNASAKQQWIGGTSLFPRVFLYSILTTIITLILPAILLIPYYLRFFMNQAAPSQIAPGQAAIFLLFIIISLIYIIVASLFLMFGQIIITRNRNPFKTIAESFKYTWNNFGHTILVFLCIILIALMLSAAVLLIIVILTLIMMASGSTLNPLILSVVIWILVFPFMASIMLYSFKAFDAKNVNVKKPEVKTKKARSN